MLKKFKKLYLALVVLLMLSQWGTCFAADSDTGTVIEDTNAVVQQEKSEVVDDSSSVDSVDIVPIENTNEAEEVEKSDKSVSQTTSKNSSNSRRVALKIYAPWGNLYNGKIKFVLADEDNNFIESILISKENYNKDEYSYIANFNSKIDLGKEYRVTYKGCSDDVIKEVQLGDTIVEYNQYAAYEFPLDAKDDDGKDYIYPDIVFMDGMISDISDSIVFVGFTVNGLENPALLDNVDIIVSKNGEEETTKIKAGTLGVSKDYIGAKLRLPDNSDFKFVGDDNVVTANNKVFDLISKKDLKNVQVDYVKATINISAKGNVLSSLTQDLSLKFKSGDGSEFIYSTFKRGKNEISIPKGSFVVTKECGDDLEVKVPSNIVISNKSSVDVEITSKNRLEVSKESKGSRVNYKFKIINVPELQDKVFTGKNPISFVVRPNESYMIQDVDTGEVTNVVVSTNKVTKVILGAGVVFSGEGSVPATGDTISLAMLFIGVGATIILCVLYFSKKKKIKVNHNSLFSLFLMIALLVSFMPSNIVYAGIGGDDPSGYGGTSMSGGWYVAGDNGVVRIVPALLSAVNPSLTKNWELADINDLKHQGRTYLLAASTYVTTSSSMDNAWKGSSTEYWAIEDNMGYKGTRKFDYMDVGVVSNYLTSLNASDLNKRTISAYKSENKSNENLFISTVSNALADKNPATSDIGTELGEKLKTVAEESPQKFWDGYKRHMEDSGFDVADEMPWLDKAKEGELGFFVEVLYEHHENGVPNNRRFISATTYNQLSKLTGHNHPNSPFEELKYLKTASGCSPGSSRCNFMCNLCSHMFNSRPKMAEGVKSIKPVTDKVPDTLDVSKNPFGGWGFIVIAPPAAANQPGIAVKYLDPKSINLSNSDLMDALDDLGGTAAGSLVSALIIEPILNYEVFSENFALKSNEITGTILDPKGRYNPEKKLVDLVGPVGASSGSDADSVFDTTKVSMLKQDGTGSVAAVAEVPKSGRVMTEYVTEVQIRIFDDYDGEDLNTMFANKPTTDYVAPTAGDSDEPIGGGPSDAWWRDDQEVNGGKVITLKPEDFASGGIDLNSLFDLKSLYDYLKLREDALELTKYNYDGDPNYSNALVLVSMKFEEPDNPGVEIPGVPIQEIGPSKPVNSANLVPQWRLTKHWKDIAEYATTSSDTISWNKSNTACSGSGIGETLSPSGDVHFNLLIKNADRIPSYFKTKEKFADPTADGMGSITLRSPSDMLYAWGDLFAMKENDGIDNIRVAKWVPGAADLSSYGIQQTSRGATPSRGASLIKTHKFEYEIDNPNTYTHTYGVYDHEWCDSCDEYHCYCYEESEVCTETNTPAVYNKGIKFLRYMPKDTTCPTFDTKEIFENGFASVTAQSPDTLKVNPEVLMLYSGRFGGDSVTFTAGDKLRGINPVSYHFMRYEAEVKPNVNSATIATDMKAKSLAANLGAGGKAVIYKGASSNISFDVDGTLTSKSYALDIGNTALKNLWNSGTTYDTQKIDDTFLANFGTKGSDGSWTLDAQGTEKLKINGKLYTENKSQLKFKEDNGDVKTHTLVVRGGKLISVNGDSNYMANIDADLKKALEEMKLIGGSSVLDVFERNSGDKLDESSLATLGNAIRGANDLAVNRGWYNEDTTVLVIREYTHVFKLPIAMYSDKLPMSIDGLNTPIDKNAYFSRGYTGHTWFKEGLLSKKGTMSPYETKDGIVDVFMEHDSQVGDKFGPRTIDYIAPNVSIMDIMQN